MAKFTPELIAKYQNSGYRVVGKHLHTGVEVCRWAKEALRGGKLCYKSIYGIKSHRCVQMTPTLNFCNLNCQWCWRTFRPGRKKAAKEWDNPKDIIDSAIEAQRKQLSGFGGNEKVTKEMLREAMDPQHFAISLDGEPTFYPKIIELIKEIKSRGFTAFLVTNGTTPNKLKEMLKKNAVPTNLYISVYGPDEETFYEGTKCKIPGLWKKVLESLKLFSKFEKKGCRTVFRITAVKGLTLKYPETVAEQSSARPSKIKDFAREYAKLIEMAKPMFVEVKGYAWLGESRKRLEQNAVPRMEELEKFAGKLVKLTKYKVKHKDVRSRVVILTKNEKNHNRMPKMQ
jgi:tRNA wybutosine-synthesizing protein 1